MENQLFREIWSTTEMSYQATNVVNKFAIESIVSPLDQNKLLNFYLFVVPVLKDPRFEIEFMVPMDAETHDYFR